MSFSVKSSHVLVNPKAVEETKSSTDATDYYYVASKYGSDKKVSATESRKNRRSQTENIGSNGSQSCAKGGLSIRTTVSAMEDFF